MNACPKCGKPVESTGSGPEWLNSYQWDAIKAGDYFAKCDTPNHPNGNCYFWRRETGELYRREPEPGESEVRDEPEV